MVRRLLLFVAVLMFAIPSHSALINRGTKAAGGTDFSTGTVIAAEMNTDLNTIYSEFNGSITTANISASAAIVLGQLSITNDLTNTHIDDSAAIVFSKMAQTAAALDADIVDDYSANAAEQDNTTTPGTSDSATTLPLNLQTEIEMLRFKLHQLGIGTTSGSVAAAGGTSTTSTWIDGPYRPGNLIRNGGFDVMDTLATGTDGDGWVEVLTPTLAASNLVESEGQGDGQGLSITGNGATLEGVGQTLNGLKASTKYLARAAVRPTTGDSCRLRTSGADTNELSVDSASDNAFEILSGTFETDSTPTDVAIQIVAVADGDVCIVDHVAVFEINTDPIPANGGGLTVTSNSSASTAAVATGGRAALPTLSIAVVPPGPNYVITVDAHANISTSATATTVWECDIDENASGFNLIGSTDVDAASRQDVFTMHHVNASPTPGTTYTYQIFCTRKSGTGTATFAGGDYPAEIFVRMEPQG